MSLSWVGKTENQAQTPVPHNLLSREAEQASLGSAVQANPYKLYLRTDIKQYNGQSQGEDLTAKVYGLATSITSVLPKRTGFQNFPPKLKTMSYETGFHGDNEAIFDCLYQNAGGYTLVSYACQLLQAPEEAAHLCQAAAAALGLVIREHR